MIKANEQEKLRHKQKVEDVTTVLGYGSIIGVYVAYAIIFMFGLIRECISFVRIQLGLEQDKFAAPKGYASLYNGTQRVFLFRVYQRVRDCFERPICSTPGPRFDIMDRMSPDENFTYEYTGSITNSLNLGSYNYLGFAENNGAVTQHVEEVIKKYGAASASPRMEGGNSDVVRELEQTIASFVGKEDAIVIGMGFATNSTTIPALCGGRGTLIISDSLNHNSIVSGSRDSGAKILVFKHNEPEDLEKVLRGAIIEGQPRTRKAWKKILIIVEGIYSMEGEICKLPEIVALKKKYKAYLYVDEAHSIGALGKTGRGVCEQTGVDPKDVDMLMGTFTKAFGSVGGYIAGSKELVEYMRHVSYGSMYATSMSPPCAQQALSALRVILGTDGTNDGQLRLKKLRDNGNYFRSRLAELGFVIFGDFDSPIVPMMVYHACKIPLLSRGLLARGIAVVVVGFPVTPLLLSRIRFCISASHSIDDLEAAIQEISRMGDILLLKYNKK